MILLTQLIPLIHPFYSIPSHPFSSHPISCILSSQFILSCQSSHPSPSVRPSIHLSYTISSHPPTSHPLAHALSLHNASHCSICIFLSRLLRSRDQEIACRRSNKYGWTSCPHLAPLLKSVMRMVRNKDSRQITYFDENARICEI